MTTLLNFDLNLPVHIHNFDQLILWLAILASIGTITTGAYLASFSKGFLYPVKTYENKNILKKFSLINLQLPFRNSYFKKILFGINSKTNTIIHKSLKADALFMPFAYATLLLLFFYFWLRFQGKPDSIIVSLLLNGWYFPLIAYVMDICENSFTASLLKKLEILKQAKTTNAEDRKLNESDKNQLICKFRIKILLASGLKWLAAIVSIAIILAALSILLL
ncbi:hypothetical protein B0A69_13740 [Chryseobacterium shigense]|uniref:Uncharacterized protein n=1 Tax=Chryseobacterium shigense TaxID=297244 RepID=A0A1N7HUM5_9FLAO|nr:hypothetical protein [Chryseobacterium shigense]PQA93203.1 hypothetical protein B0A69_13740 [Chryseobacterium shigense]SIS28564.1 hypothetical protein SAMN05421639_101207 [Chryseobacterium shigense]